jgi:lipopolysaccharide heptosyltransferase I
MFELIRRNKGRSPLADIDARRICLIKPSALGDVVQALPVLSALRGRFPQAHIAWVVNRSYAGLLADHPHLDEIIAFDRGAGGMWSRAAWRGFAELNASLRERRFDLAVDLQGLLRSGLMARATGAARRVGLSDTREGARFCYTDVVSMPAAPTSAVERYWLVAAAIGAEDAVKQFVVCLGASDRDWAARAVGRHSGLRVAIHPGARWATKRWPAAHFAELARRIGREFDAAFILVGGPEESSAAAELESSLASRTINLVGKTTLKQLAAVLGDVDVVITNDSGPMHLAAAVGTPVVGIFTCTSPERARPFGPGHLLVSSKVWCAASYLKKCARMDCMTELVPDHVWPAVRAHIATLRASLAQPA